MPLFRIAAIWCAGWLLYRLFQRNNLELSPATIALSWVLGTCILYLTYYSCILIGKQSPPPIIMIGLGLIGLVEFIRLLPKIQINGWRVFRQSKLLTVVLLLVIGYMSLHILFDGYHYDTIRMWLFKAHQLSITPNYTQVINSLIPIQHPDYPMLYPHQLQWQLAGSDSLFSLKLPTWMAYISIILAMNALFTHFEIERPVVWLVFLAGFPQFWLVIPTATADLPLSMMLIVGIVWLNRYLDGDTLASPLMAFVFGAMVLTKNEGILLVLSVIVGLCVMAITRSHNPKRLLQAILWIIGVASVAWVSWYSFVVGQASATIISDFGFISLTPERIIEVIGLLIPILFNPFLTVGIWIFVVGCFLTGHFRFPIIWMPMMIYLVLISSTYLFSVRETGLYAHVVQSYLRLLTQITPLAIFYLATSFSNTPTEIYEST